LTVLEASEYEIDEDEDEDEIIIVQRGEQSSMETAEEEGLYFILIFFLSMRLSQVTPNLHIDYYYI
jgi:hypothetical protein